MLQTKSVPVFVRNTHIWYGFNSQFSKYRYTSTSSVFFASLFLRHWHMHHCCFYLHTMSNNIGVVIIRKYSIFTQWPCTVSLLGPQIYILDSMTSVILSHLMWWIDVDSCTFCQMQLVWRTLPWFYSVCLGATRTRWILTVGGKKMKNSR